MNRHCAATLFAPYPPAIWTKKVRLARETASRWFARRTFGSQPLDPPLPERPGRPEKPELVPPRMLKKRSLNTEHGRIALMHALAHIELERH
ncbi:DUF455 family protein [Brucella abortus]|nr:DUF455 family protein [Brucella abortus]